MLWEGISLLIDGAKRGDAEALNRLYALAQPYLLRLAQKTLGPTWPDKSVSDLTQETWMRAWQSIADFNGAGDDANTGAIFRAWLARTMKNVWHNDVRYDNAQRRRPEFGLVSLAGNDSSVPTLDPMAGDPTPSENVRQEEQFMLLEQALEKLPDVDDRDIVRYRFVDGLSFADIGKRLERDESTIRYRLQRVLQFLGDTLKESP